MMNESDKAYISSDIKLPYFLLTGDAEYKNDLDMLYGLGFNLLRLSGFCENDDTQPDIDKLIAFIEKQTDESNKYVVAGLGEYLAFIGKSNAHNILSRFKYLQTNNNRVVLLLRGITDVFESIRKQDPTRIDNRRFSIPGNSHCAINLALMPNDISFSYLSGIQEYIKTCEDGIAGTIYLFSTLDYKQSIFPYREISNTYELVKIKVPELNVPAICGNNDQWASLLDDLSNNDNLLDMVFKSRNLQDNADILFDDYACRDTAYINWLAFIKLKQNASLLSGYRRYVIDRTEIFADFRKNVLRSIIDIPSTDKRFHGFYLERKGILNKFKNNELIADFIIENRKNPENSIYHLTNVTSLEKEEMITLFKRLGKKDVLFENYPDLKTYLNKYFYRCGDLSQKISEYFEEYRLEKLNNKIEDKMIEMVGEFATSKIYSRLPSRNEIITKYNSQDNYLYWLDALGVEYAAYISGLAAQKDGLAVTIEIGRADLPSITSLNRGFFDDWKYGKNIPNGDKRLDEIKHKDNDRYDFTKTEEPIHLSRELEIIKEIIEKAALALYERKCKYFIIASDHGASRLAVIKKQEEKYETDTKGEHSGRCCKITEENDIKNSIEENGYIILTDYGRFKGSRAANVEIHGGASLEEVLVPIVVLSLKDTSIKIELVDKPITASYRKNAEFTIFSKTKLKNVSATVNEINYIGKADDENHWTFSLLDIHKAGSYTAEILEGDNSIAVLNLNVQNEGGKKNTAFDDLF
jgi:hypothetical protein